MNIVLPTVEQLERLPMLAVVAYAGRTARRLSAELRGIVADDALDDLLRLVDAVWTNGADCDASPVTLIYASHRVVEAYASVSDELASTENFLVVFSVTNAARVAMNVLRAIDEPERAEHHFRYAAQIAERVAHNIGKVTSPAAAGYAEAARHDYEVLLNEYGEHDNIVLGDPVVCFDNP